MWIRHTVHKRPGEPMTASVWFTVFDAEADAPIATKITVPEAELSAPGGGYITVDGATFAPGAAQGRVDTDALSATWDLTYEDANDPFKHLPYDFLYGAPLPKTKFLSPYPDTRYSGTVTVGDRVIELDGWPGMVGHNWGAEHAERWVWIQASELEGVGTAKPCWFDMAVGRIKIGPWTTPWVGNGMLYLDGERHRLGGFDRVRGTKVSEKPTSCDFGLTGKGISVSGRVSSEPQELRRLGLRRPGRPRAQHPQLLDLRPRADRRAGRQADPPPGRPRSGRLRVRHARFRPRDPGSAVSRRLEPSQRPRGSTCTSE